MFKVVLIIRRMCCNQGSTSRKLREKRAHLGENGLDSLDFAKLIILAQFDFSGLERDQYISNADWLLGEVSEKK